MKNKNFYPILVGGILILALWLRLWGINFGLPYLYQTEEYLTVNYALKMAGTRDLNPHSFIYPTLYLYFMIIVYGIWFVIGKISGIYIDTHDFAISFVKDPTTVYIIGRLFSALFGTLVVIGTYFLGKLLYNKRTGIISALMVAILPIWVRYSHYIKPEMCSNFLVVIYAIFLYKYYLTGEQKFFYYSGILLGLATSTKYLSLPAGILMPIIYFYRNKRINIFDKKFWLGIGLVTIFFVIGTPFSIMDLKTFARDIFGHMKGPQIGLQRNIINGIIATLKDYIFMGNETPIIGGICFLGVIYGLLKHSVKEVLLILVFLTYFLVNATHYFPAWGFLFTAFPFFIILGANFVDKMSQKTKLFYPIFFIFLLLSVYESIKIDISFSLLDTRTLALKWIEKNVPFDSKILIDRYPSSPPLKMTKKQLEKLYKKAVELNHYKKEYLKLQLEAHLGENYGYEIYEVYHPPHEIGTVTHMVEEAQKVRPLVDISSGIDYLKKMGVKYVITNSYSEEGALRSDNPALINFYQSLDKEYQLVVEFLPKTKLHPGPVIKVRKLQ